MSFTALSHEECMRRLGERSVGRISVTSRALPVIVPVNYVLTGRTIVFRTEPGGMLANATDDTVVAFEVDDLADDGRSGWSVLAVGVAQHVDGSREVRAVESAVSSAVGDGRDLFISITIGQLSGRAVAADDPAGEPAEPANVMVLPVKSAGR